MTILLLDCLRPYYWMLSLYFCLLKCYSFNFPIWLGYLLNSSFPGGWRSLTIVMTAHTLELTYWWLLYMLGNTKTKRAKIAANLCFRKKKRDKKMDSIIESYLPVFTQYTNMSVTRGIVPPHQVIRTHLHTVFICGIFGVIRLISGPVVFRNSFFSSGPHKHTLLVSVCCI